MRDGRLIIFIQFEPDADLSAAAAMVGPSLHLTVVVVVVIVIGVVVCGGHEASLTCLLVLFVL